VTTYDADVALRATGVLRAFNDAGVLTAADVHVAQRLGALGGERDEAVLLAAALAVRSLRHGSVVTDLDAVRALAVLDDGAVADDGLPWPAAEAWVSRCAASPLVAVGDAASRHTPLRLLDGRVWLDRYWKQERLVADELLRRSGPVSVDTDRLASALSRLFPENASGDQKVAAGVCALSRVAVIAGGPGTGKTTTVARLLAVLHDQPHPPARVALAAPTGKAAARLQESVEAVTLPAEDRQRVGELSASTIHRLLGRRPGSRTRFWHDRENRLPYDVVVVDECSMVSLTLMARLLDALRPDARLVLVGDPDQLASVEAGAVLGDLVDRQRVGERTAGSAQRLQRLVAVESQVVADTPGARLRDGIAVLSRVHRFSGAIGELAEAVRQGNADAALAVLRAGDAAAEWFEVPDDEAPKGGALQAVRDECVAIGGALVAAAEAGDVKGALAALDAHRLLCAHRTGPRGVQHWTRQVQQWVAAEHDLAWRADGRYPGQPLLVTANDYDTGLFNGDTGVVVRTPDGLVAAFGRGGEPILRPLSQLGDVRTLHAMTVHRSQGSQFAAVTVLLPPASSPLGTRETLYTAVTRGERRVRVIGSQAGFVAAVQRPVARATGLRSRLA
jgi:exodeoxyribonuclease V alpha subunit